MPSQKSRSKEDTWSTDELSRALNKTGERRHHREKDEDRKRDRINGEDRHRRTKDDDSDRRHRDDERRRRPKDDDDDDRDRLTEEERERLRQERRQKRESKDGGREKKPKEEVKFRGKAENRHIDLDEIEEDDDRQRRHRSDKDRRHKDDDRDRRHKDDKDRRHKDDDRDRRRGRDVDNEEVERERRRVERRRQKEEEEGKKRSDEKGSRHRDRDDRSERHKDRDERHRDRDDRDRDERHRDRGEKSRDKKDRETEREREERKEREREERRREREERHQSKDSSKHKSSRHKEEEEEKEEKKQEEEDGADEYEEDFEDYEEDFEEDDEEEEKNVDEKPTKYGRTQHNDELNDVLRALDEENERLLNSSSRSPAGSAHYGRGDSGKDRRYHDNREDDSDDDSGKVYQPRMDRPRTAINFVSAKQRAINRKTSSKTMQRGQDLLKMIELDYANFDILDLPPVGEYDMYIRAFGSTGTRQVYVQTNDDNIDRDIQTEEVDVRQKWTQHPAEDFAGCGRGDGEKDIDEEEQYQTKQHKEQDTGRLNMFLQKAGQVIAILLEEEKVEEGGSQSKSNTHLTISEGYTQLTGLSILKDRHVIYSHFSPTQPHLLLTVYSPPSQVSEDNPVSKRGIICVWNTNEPNYPQKILACGSEPRCCCFSPVRPSLVFAGMVDGSIAMWDLREPAALHQPTTIHEEKYSLRYPTYDTAGVLPEENHHSPVSAIMPVYSYITSSKSDSGTSEASEDSESGLSFQLVSTEEAAVLNFWVVAELSASDPAGSQTDYGLAPGATVKLLKSSSLIVVDPNRDSQLKAGVRVIDMRLLPSDPNQFYLATDSGKVVHGMRFGKRAFPRAHSPAIETIVDVFSIDFSPFDQPCFLIGCSDGSFSIYHTKTESPLVTWWNVTQGKAVQCVRWSRSRACVFYVLDASSTLYIFDLLEGDNTPKHVENISKEKVTSLCLTNDHRADGLGHPNKDAQILFSLGDGTTEIHTISRELRDPQDLEKEFLASYLQRF